MNQKITLVDAFADRPFSGNPAGVCILTEPRDASWMQNIAMEMNAAETAFLHPEQDGYRLRWFSPLVEIDLCGHATLASAHILWEDGHLPKEETARFYTNSGLLTAVRNNNWIEMDFPAERETAIETPPGLSEALGTELVYVGQNRFDILAEVTSEEMLRMLNPDLAFIAKLPCRGVMVTTRSDSPDYDFISRFFAPSAGITEDPATGSSHCCLGPYWSKKLNKSEMIGYQASRRSGLIKIKLNGERIILCGKAVTTLRCELLNGID